MMMIMMMRITRLERSQGAKDDVKRPKGSKGCKTSSGSYKRDVLSEKLGWIVH